MGSFLVVLAVLAAGTAFGLQKTWRSAKSLRQHSVRELSQLKSELANRQLIVTHLLDSLPESFDAGIDRAQCRKTCEQAESSLRSIDTQVPTTAAIVNSIEHQRDLVRLLIDLTKRIEADESIRDAQAVSACLNGLEESDRRIRDSVSTYNASAITYTNYLERPITSMIARFLPAGQFELFKSVLHSDGGAADSAGP